MAFSYTKTYHIFVLSYAFMIGGVTMGEETRVEKEQKKIILPKDVQVEMMQFFLRTSIPKKKQLREEQLKLEQEKVRPLTPSDGSDT